MSTKLPYKNMMVAVLLGAVLGCVSVLVKADDATLTPATHSDAAIPAKAKGQPLTLEQAYQIQTMAVKERLAGANPQGFKAGLTSAATQQKFAIDQPIAGVLVNGGTALSEASGTVDSAIFSNLMVEVELGFSVNSVIDRPLADVESLKKKIDKVYPVVELPDFNFDNLKRIRAVDLVVNNVAAKQFLYGEGRDLGQIDINQLPVLMQKDGVIILSGRGEDALGDQWRALLWLVNRTVKNGWQIQPGQLLITGALGKMMEAKPGLYQVDYGELGGLELTIQ